MSAPLKIIALITATAGGGERLEAEMKTLVEEVRQEPGCRHYDLYRATEDGTRFVFVEEWEDQELWQAHMAGPAIEAFNARITGLIAKGEILQLRRVV